MSTSLEVLPLEEPTASIAVTTSRPSITFPKTICFPSSQEVTAVVMKNWEPLVFGPDEQEVRRMHHKTDDEQYAII